MILKSCYIDNYGKISDFEYVFNNQINVIYENNSWGKTTFCHFIYSMLYGFEKGKRNDVERKFYEPWQGGTYGGMLVVEVDNKEYKIYRTFGAKDKDDTFKLIEASTGKETNEYSDNIGEELLGIDRHSFLKSIYIPQNAQTTSMTDGISAKMGDLASVKGDISEFEIVMKMLETEKKKYNSRSKESLCKKISEEISEKKRLITTRDNLYVATNLKEEFIKQQQMQLKEEEERKNIYKTKLEKQSKRTQDIALHNEAKKMLMQRKMDFESITQKYGGKEINSDDVAMLDNYNRKISKIQNEIEFLGVDETCIAQYKELKEKYPKGFPNNDDIEKIEVCVDKIRLAQFSLAESGFDFDEKEYDVLCHEFEEIDVSVNEIDEEINNYNKSKRLEEEINELKLEMAQAATKGNSSLKHIISMLVLLVVIAIATVFVLNKMFILVPIVVVLGLLIEFAVYNMLGKEDRKNKIHVSLLESQISEKQKEKVGYEQLYTEFAQKFRVKYSENMMTVLLNIRESYKRFLEMKQVKDAYHEKQEKINRQIEDSKSIVLEILSRHLNGDDVIEADNFAIVIGAMKEDALRFEQLHTKITAYSEKYDTYSKLSDLKNRLLAIYSVNEENESLIKDFSELQRQKSEISQLENKVESLAKTLAIDDDEEGAMSVIEINDIITGIDEIISRHKDEISSATRDLEIMYTQLEDYDGLEEEIGFLNVQLNEYNNKSKLLEETMDCLQKSKDRFTSKYLSPLKNSFIKYVKRINGVDYETLDVDSLDLDIDLNVSINYGAMTKSGKSLSSGYKDLVSICTRLSLLDAMYQEEKPIIILDDPFVNLDESKIINAVELIKEVAKDYQVIYFTCHKSRTI